MEGQGWPYDVLKGAAKVYKGNTRKPFLRFILSIVFKRKMRGFEMFIVYVDVNFSYQLV